MVNKVLLFLNLRFLTHWLLLLGMAVITACDSEQNTGNNNQQTPALIKLQLGWFYDYSAVPLFVAEQSGHFAAQAVQIELIDGGIRQGQYINAIDEVLQEHADLGITDGYNLLLARSQGKPVVAIAALLQRSPSAILSLAEKGFVHPSDLIGKKLALTGSGVTWKYRAMLATQNISLGQLEVVPRKGFGIEQLLSGEVDAMSGWVTNEGVAIIEAGHQVKAFVMSDYGTDSYPKIIFTTEKMITERSAVIERFMRALLAGFWETIKQPDQSIETILQYDETLDLIAQRNRLHASLPYINPANSKPALMHEEIWRATQQIMLDEKLLTEPIDLEKAYTMEFLNKIYSE